MSARPTCEEVQALTSEVALGVASGDERAQVLAQPAERDLRDASR